jgi:hypothetical protein
MKPVRISALAFLVTLIIILRPGVVHAQQDGPRGYMLSPEGIHGLVFANVYVEANQAPDHGTVVVDSDITSYLAVPLYSQPFTVAGNVASLFVVQPVGSLEGSVDIAGQTMSNSSSGLGDFAFGGMVGLVGMPSLPMESYLTYDPGFALTAVVAASAPTGEYDQTDIFNLGQNRWLFRLALPMTYTLGDSFVDPDLTTFELMPSVTFFTVNDAPFGAQRQTQEPLFQLEGHITRNLNSKVWVSADAIYAYGALGSTNGVSDNNTRMNVNLAGTLGVNLNPAVQLRLSYGHSVANNDYGFDGQGFRLMLVGGF